MQNIQNINKSWKIAAKKLLKRKNMKEYETSFLVEISSKKRKKILLIEIKIFFTYFLLDIVFNKNVTIFLINNIFEKI
jgi:hypothetical protein